METQLSFFNTIDLKGEDLKGARESCNRQEERILGIMSDKEARTPFQVYMIYERLYNSVPITSIRRAMTVLTKGGKLEKLNEKRQGNYGLPNHKWKIK